MKMMKKRYSVAGYVKLAKLWEKIKNRHWSIIGNIIPKNI